MWFPDFVIASRLDASSLKIILEYSGLSKSLPWRSKAPYKSFIDFTKKFKDENNNLKVEYTIDGTHLTEAGYEVFYNEIKDLIWT